MPSFRCRLRCSILIGSLIALLGARAEAEWRVTGHLGGPISALATHSTLLYVGVGLRVHIYDVSDPAAARETGSTVAFSDFISDIAIAGSRAYVTAGRDGLHILDIADPANPRQIGNWNSPGSAEGVAVVGTRAYVADGPFGVHIVDLTEPASPVLVSSVFDTNFAFDVGVRGNNLFVAAAGAGLLVADIGDGLTPRQVAVLDTPGFSRALAMSDTTLYVADQWGGVRIVDIADPVRTREIGAIPIQSWAFDVTVSGSTLHVAAGSAGFRAFDVAVPEDPRPMSVYDIPWNLSWKIAVSGTRAFLAVRTQGVTILDVADPSAARRLGAISPLSNAQAVAARGALALIGTESQGVRIVDFSDASRPRERGPGNTNDYVWAVVVDESRAYACEGYGPRHFLRVYDFANPDQPAALASARIPQGHCRDLMLRETWLYMPDEFGLQIWDVSNPAAPVTTGIVNLPESGGVDQTSGTESVDVVGSTAFVDTQRGVSVIDITDRRNPRLAGSWSPEYTVQFFDLSAHGQFVYAVTGIPFPEIFVLEIKDAARLVFVGATRIPAPGLRVIVRDKKAYVAAGAAGVAVIDVSNPAAPVAAGRISLPGFAKELTFAGDRLLVASSDAGLFILEQTSAPSSMPLHTGAATDSLATPTRDIRLPAFDTTPMAAPVAIQAAHIRVVSGRTITVTSQADSGPGTLREALTTLQAGDSITFDPVIFPPTTPATIRLQSPLPRVAHDSVTIDASNAGVVLDGSALSGTFEAGIEIQSKDNIVKGLQILNFPYAGMHIYGNGGNVIGGDRSRGTGPSGEGNVISANRSAGITVSKPSGNRIVGNLIGTDVTGRRGLGRQNIGLHLFSEPGRGNVTGPDRIGGTEPWEANVISGNDGAEIYLHNGRGYLVLGNFLGTDPTGIVRVGSSANGIATSAAAGNVISGNVIAGEQFGIIIIDTGSHCNLIANNWIGVTKGGSPLTTNPYDGGVSIFESFNTVVGNTIRNGVSVTNIRGNPTETVIIGNALGPGSLPERPPGQEAGVRIDSAWRTFIGGATTAEQNLISGKTLGIWVQTPGIDRTFVLGNIIRNSVVGMDLGSAASSVLQGNVITNNERGVTISAPTNHLRRNSIYANPAGAVLIDAAASAIPPPPLIADVTLTTVRGMACPRCTVEIYSDPSSQGRWYEGTTTANAVGVFSYTTPTILRGPNVTATATDQAGSTSAFSAPFAAPPPGPRRRAVRR